MDNSLKHSKLNQNAPSNVTLRYGALLLQSRMLP